MCGSRLPWCRGCHTSEIAPSLPTCIGSSAGKLVQN
uniref:Uncharacterized protein n=1 Tax=Arundo donax TaxID=35708 RepID=A0A0A8ZKD0_ARUDO